MLEIVLTLKATLRSVLKTRPELVLENLALRHQLAVLRRAHRRPRLRPSERLLWVALRRFWEGWKEALGLVRPGILLRPVKGRAYFFRVRKSQELLQVLEEWKLGLMEGTPLRGESEGAVPSEGAEVSDEELKESGLDDLDLSEFGADG